MNSSGCYLEQKLTESLVNNGISNISYWPVTINNELNYFSFSIIFVVLLATVSKLEEVKAKAISNLIRSFFLKTSAFLTFTNIDEGVSLFFPEVRIKY